MNDWSGRYACVIPSHVVVDMMQRRTQKERGELCPVWNGDRSRATVFIVPPAKAGSPKATLKEIVRDIAQEIRSIFVWGKTHASQRTES